MTGHHPGFSYTAFEMSTAILLGVTGVSRAPALVLDVQTHYLDRLLLTPGAAHRHTDRPHGRRCRRGRRVDRADPDPRDHPGRAVRNRAARGRGVRAARIGVEPGVRGFGYAIALKTGNPAAVSSMFLLFFPFLFLTSSYVPAASCPAG